MRKNIALMLALVMVLSLVPMTAFARSDNSINYVPTVADDHVFSTADAPMLIIEDDGAGAPDFVYGEEQTFRLNLTNAEFAGFIAQYDGKTDESGDFDLTVTRRTDTSVTVTAEPNVDPGTSFKTIQLLMLAELDGEGEARVTIDPLNSKVTGGTYTFAVGVSGETTAFVDDVETISRGRNQRGGNIIIDEVTAGSLGKGTHGFRLRLPSDFHWEDDTVVRFEGLNVSGVANNVDYTEGTGSMTINADDRDLTVRFEVDEVSTTRGSIIIEPSINVTRDARYGDVNVTLTGYGDVSNESGLKIAEYEDYGFTYSVEEDGEKEFLAGRLYDNNDEEYEIEFTIEETVDDSFVAGRSIDFVLPSWVWILDIETDDDAKVEHVDLDKLGDNEFSYEIQDGDEELTFTLKITINGNAPFADSEDIMMEVNGPGIDTEIQLGVARKPVVVEVAEQTAELSIGVMNQPAPEFTVTETVAGALIEGETLEMTLRNVYGESLHFDDFKVEVVEGDIEISPDDDGTWIGAEIDTESTVASTLRFYDIKLGVDRTAPMGWYQLDAKGSALIQNTASAYDGNYAPSNFVDDIEEALKEADFSTRTFRTDYVSVGTPVDLSTTTPVGGAQVAFTVGQSTYTVDGETKTMDVAPIIMNDRTMVPVRYLEELFGMQPVWNPTSRTVTVMFDGKVFEMAIGSNVLRVNGAPFMEMDAEATIVGDRTFVPASRFARAMGIPYVWDAATQTATFN